MVQARAPQRTRHELQGCGLPPTHAPPQHWRCSPPAAWRRPHVVWELKDYSKPSPDKGRADARTDAPFLFKAFETGQVRVQQQRRGSCPRGVLPTVLPPEEGSPPPSHSPALNNWRLQQPWSLTRWAALGRAG